MPFKNEEEKQQAKKAFEEGLLYSLHLVAVRTRHIDGNAKYTDAQKKSIIIDFINDGTIRDGKGRTMTGVSTFESLSDMLFESYYDDAGSIENTFGGEEREQLLKDLKEVIYIRNTGKFEPVYISSPGFTDYRRPEDCYALAYVPSKGFNNTLDKMAGKISPSMILPIKDAAARPEYIYEDPSVQRKRHYDHAKGALGGIMRDMNATDSIFSRDSSEYIHLQERLRGLAGSIQAGENSGQARYSFSELKSYMEEPDNEGHSLLDYAGMYIREKSRSTEDLSERQVSRMSVCYRLQDLYGMIKKQAEQEVIIPDNNIHNAVDLIGLEQDDYLVSLETLEKKESIREGNERIEGIQKEVNRLTRKKEQLKTDPKDPKIGAYEKKIKDLKASAVETYKAMEDIKDDADKNDDLLRARERNMEKAKQSLGDSYAVYSTRSDLCREEIANKLLLAKLEGLGPKIKSNVMKDRELYADFISRIKESKEFKEIAFVPASELSRISMQSPAELLKTFRQPPVNARAAGNEKAFTTQLKTIMMANPEKKELYTITEYLLRRSNDMMEELNSAESRYHSDSYRQFKSSLENLHSKILELGGNGQTLNTLSMEDLKGVLAETSIAAQTYQMEHRGKTVSGMGLNDNIIKRLQVATEMNVIYDYLSSPQPAEKSYKGLMTDLCAMRFGNDNFRRRTSSKTFGVDMAGYSLNRSKTENLKKIDDYAACLTDFKNAYKPRVMARVKANDGFKQLTANKSASELKDLFGSSENIAKGAKAESFGRQLEGEGQPGSPQLRGLS